VGRANLSVKLQQLPDLPNLVKGLQVEAPERLTGGGPDLCAATRRRGLPGLAARAHVLRGASPGTSMRSCHFKRLKMALAQWVVPVGLIHHCDRGDSLVIMPVCSASSVSGSTTVMSTAGPPTENALVENFLKTVKWEQMDVHHYRTFKRVAEFADVS
jgi:hypothetical protein